MRFTSFSAVVAASAVAANPAPAESSCTEEAESTVTFTYTFTVYSTVTICADTNPGCLESATSFKIPAEITSEMAIVEPPSTPSYPVFNTTIWVGPTAVVPTSILFFETETPSTPVVTEETPFVQPSSPSAEEPSEVPTAGAAGLDAQSGLLAGVVALAVGALV